MQTIINVKQKIPSVELSLWGIKRFQCFILYSDAGRETSLYILDILVLKIKQAIAIAIARQSKSHQLKLLFNFSSINSQLDIL